MGNNIQIFGRTFSDVSSITVNNTSSSAVKYVQEPIFEDITISQDYLAKQNTVISNGIIFQTDETYPGTPVVLNNTTYANINNGDLGQNGTGIKIDLNKTYHCTGELKIEWSTGEQEIYSIDSDFTPTSYNYSASLPNFSWEGIGISTQTFGQMNLDFQSSSANGYKIFMRPGTSGNTQITKSGVLLDGSYYQISVTSNGFNTINLNLSDDPRFQAIYKSLAYRSTITSSAPGVSEWCNSLSRISRWQFAGQDFSGSFTFNNVTSVWQGAFGVVWNGNGASVQTSAWFNFPNSALSVLPQDMFFNNGMIRGISANNVNLISTNAFCSCTNLSEVNFPNCATISDSAFYSCRRLFQINFPNCTSIGSYAFQSCSSLSSISFQNCTTIGASTFYGCSSLSSISFPNCTIIGNYAFSNCSALTVVSFPNCISLSQYAFRNCTNLSSFYFMGSSIPSITVYTFQYTPLSTSSYLGYYGSIYVPASLLASYKTTTNWTAYSSRMVGI